MAFSPIETQRLRIRSFVPEDWPAVYADMSDPAVWTRFAALRDYAWQGPEALAEVRAAWAP
ncbi:MAG TPA: hypothetical protein VFO59_09890, partial [Dehalococcoidia bacterium]|nr:hypothetical protein [Dehalococcoidia bacterium]